MAGRRFCENCNDWHDNDTEGCTQIQVVSPPPRDTRDAGRPPGGVEPSTN